MGEADNCFENCERLSCEKGIKCVFYGPSKRSIYHQGPHGLNTAQARCFWKPLVRLGNGTANGRRAYNQKGTCSSVEKETVVSLQRFLSSQG